MPFHALTTMESELEGFEVTDMHTSEKQYLVKTRELNQRMFRDRHQLSFWLELLDVQDLARDSIFAGKDKLILEKKLSILDKAFEIPNLQKSLYLRLLRLDLLRASEKNEDQHKMVTREFGSMLSSLPDPDGQVLVLFLDFRHSYFVNFSASMLRKSVAEAIESFKDSLESAASTAEIKKYETLLFLVLVYGLTAELRMGYSEKAIGVLAALTQINVVCNHLTAGISAEWEDHRVLKVGESDPATSEEIFDFEDRLIATLGSDTDEAKQAFLIKDTDSFEQLVDKERLYSKAHWRPANSMHDKVVQANSATHRARYLFCGHTR